MKAHPEKIQEVAIRNHSNYGDIKFNMDWNEVLFENYIKILSVTNESNEIQNTYMYIKNLIKEYRNWEV